MTENDMRVLAIFANVVLLLFMLGSGLWVGYDARKTGRTTAETITWAVFTTLFIGVGLVLYIIFKNKIYKK